MAKKWIFLWTLAFLLLLPGLFPAGDAAAAGAAGADVEEYRIALDGKEIYGKLYLPGDAAFPLPLVILSHGLGSDHTIMEPYAEIFAENGIAAYVFDFYGGSEHTLSGGSLEEMSVLTETANLNGILDRFLRDTRFSGNRIFLLGGNQGGFVSAYVAGSRPEDVAGLILLYPAFNLQHISLSLIPDSGEIPETAVIGEHTVGRAYLQAMQGFDIYQVLQNYTGPVLLFHGTDDPFVPMEFSRRAAEELRNAELVIVKGAGHGFSGEDLLRVARMAVEYVLRHPERPAEDAAPAA